MDFFITHISNKASDYVNQVLKSSFLSEGKLVEKFEKKIEDSLGINNVVAVNSGTSALHLALILADIGIGDEVIIPSQTFVATGLAVLMVGAKPVFADIDITTGNICVTDLKNKISPNTKAIIPVHWAGYPCEMQSIIELAKKHNLQVIEDAAHAFGAKYFDKPIGSISNYTCFSFQAIKHITTGDGGAIAIKDDNKYLEAKKLRWFGIDRVTSKIGILGEREYNLENIGYKYHLNDYAAALGLANLDDLEFILKRRKIIYEFYVNNIIQNEKLTLLKYDIHNESANWLFTFLVKDRSNFIKYLKIHDIPSSVVHIGIHKNKLFKADNQELKGQRYFDEHQIAIPLHSNLTDEEIKHIVSIINKWGQINLNTNY